MECKRCNKKPHEIKSVVYFSKEEGVTPEEFIRDNDGTYNDKIDKFICNTCYIIIGTPLGKA